MLSSAGFKIAQYIFTTKVTCICKKIWPHPRTLDQNHMILYYATGHKLHIQRRNLQCANVSCTNRHRTTHIPKQEVSITNALEDDGVAPNPCAIEVRRNVCIASTWLCFHKNVGAVDRASHVGKPAHILKSIYNMLQS